MNIKLHQLCFTISLIFLASFSQAKDKNKDLLFIKNEGQIKTIDGKTDKQVSYMVRSNGVNIYISTSGLKYQFIKNQKNAPFVTPKNSNEKQNFETQAIQMQLLGTNPDAEIIALDEEIFTEYYYTNNQNIKANSYKKVLVKNIYNGIDWILYAVNGNLKYDFIVNAGADYHQIKMKYKGIKDIKILPNKSLRINAAMGNIIENAPYTYLENSKTEVKSSFKLNGNTLTFDLKTSQKNSEKIVIDPGLEWATYYGGSESDEGRATVVDSEGNVYLAGLSKSYSNISTFGSHQDAYSGNYDMFLVKFDADGNRIWATYYGDGGNDYAQTLAIDADDNLYLGGDTYSSVNMTSNGHQNTFGGDVDGILVKLNKDGIMLWATYYGGTNLDGIQSVSIDKNYNILITGLTYSENDIATSGSYHENLINDYGFPDVYLAKFDSSGARLWGTYYGGTYEEGAGAVKADNNNNIYISGYTGSDDSIFYNGHQKDYDGFSDGYIAKFDENGTILWSTYYGGTQYDLIYGLDIDRDNNLYVTGYTQSYNGIAKNGFQNSKSDLNQYSEAFLSKFSSNGTLIWGTYYGDQDNDYGNAVFVDENDNIYMTGLTKSTKNISFNGMFNTNGGSDDAFLAKFDKNGNRKWATYFGGKQSTENNLNLSGQDYGYAICGDKKGHILIAGTTLSRDRIAFNGFKDTISESFDAFLAKFYTDRIYVANVNTSLCLGSDFDIDFKQTIDMGFGNTIRVEQSDAAGSFTNPQLLTTINDSTTKDFYGNYTPKGTLKVGDYFRLRFITSMPADTIYLKDTIFVNTVPMVNLQVSPANEFCDGDSAILQTNSNINYQYDWYRNDTILANKNASLTTQKAGVYKVEVSEKGCNNVSQEETIIVNPIPLKPIITRNGRALNTTTFANYQWYKDGKIIDKATSQNYTVTEDGDYSVKVKNTEGCENESDKINVSIAGISSQNKNFANAYPVPTNQFLNIETSQNCEMILMDMNGKILASKNISKGISTIDMSEYAAGIYIIKLQNDTQHSELKIIKE